MTWESHWDGGPHEANFLKLDCSRVKHIFGWKPTWDVKNGSSKDGRVVQDMVRKW